MTSGFCFERVGKHSHLIDDAARLHVACLPGTLTSSRGASVVAGIYRRLIRAGHSLYVARNKDSLLGGLMVMVHGRSRATSFTIIHQLWSWGPALRKLGVLEIFQQVRDLIKVTHHTSQLAPHDYIVALYVDEQARRLGLARQLLSCAARDSAFRGVDLGVDTLQDNVSARKLYASFGFREVVTTPRSQVFILLSE